MRVLNIVMLIWLVSGIHLSTNSFADELTLEIKATEKSWIQISKDNEKPESFTLFPDNIKTIKAASRFHIILGNAGGVEVFFQGEPLGAIGNHGERKELILPKDAPSALESNSMEIEENKSEINAVALPPLKTQSMDGETNKFKINTLKTNPVAIDGSGSMLFSSINRSIILFVVSSLILLIVLIFCLHFIRRKILIRALLSADSFKRTAILDKLCKKEKRQKEVANKIINILTFNKKESTRAAAIDTLFLIADMKKSGITKAQCLDLSLKDLSYNVRRAALERVAQSPNSDIIDRLVVHTAIEQDPKLLNDISSVIRQWKTSEVRSDISGENFDKAEKCIRELLTFNYDKAKAIEMLEQIASLRKHQVERKIQLEKLDRQERATTLVLNAGEKLSKNDCDAAETIIKKALTENPNNQEAQNLLKKLPELRKQLLLADLAKKHEANEKNIEAHRTMAIEALEKGELDKASSALLSLTALVPDDTWAKQALEEMPRLQSEKRRVDKERTSNERIEKIRKLNIALSDHWNKKDLKETQKTIAELTALVPKDENLSAFEKKVSGAILKEKAEALYNEAQKYLKTENYSKAEETYRILTTYNTEKTRIDSALQQISILRKQSDEKIARDEVIKISAQADKLREEAEKLFKQGNFEKALMIIEEAIALLPGDSVLGSIKKLVLEETQRQKVEKLTSSAMKLLENGDLDKAESALRALLPLLNVNDGTRIINILDKIPDIRQKNQAAIEVSELNKMKAKSQKAFRTGQQLFEAGDLSKCAKSLRQAIALDPDSEIAFQLLNRVHQLDSSQARQNGINRNRFNEYGEIIE